MSGSQFPICVVFKRGWLITLSEFQFLKCKGEPRSLCCVLFMSAMTAVMRWRGCALLEITSIASSAFTVYLHTWHSFPFTTSSMMMNLILSYHYCHHRHHHQIIKLIVIIIATIIIIIIRVADLLRFKELLWNEKQLGIFLIVIMFRLFIIIIINHHHHLQIHHNHTHHSIWPLGTQGAPLKWEAGWPSRGAATPLSWINIEINIMII